MELIDTHCHLSVLEHVTPEEALRNAALQRVLRVVCVGSVQGTASAFDAVRLAEQHDCVWAAVGIHPHDAGDFTTLEAIEQLAAHPRVVAIGETGLDFYRDWSPREQQYKLFENTVALARNAAKPLIIHCRDALEETYAVLRRTGAAEVGGVFHCYAGDADFALRIAELNFVVSFPGSITFRRADELRRTAAEIHLDQIMLETDCPYMAPEPFRGKPSEPAHVRLIAEKLAEIRSLTVEEVAAATTANAERLFRLPPI